METTTKARLKNDKYSVKDPLNIVLTMLFTLVCTITSYYLNLIYFKHQSFDFTICVIALALLFMFVLRLVAVWNGVEFDFDKNTIEFPGGQIAANSVVDYINPKFIFQFFGRNVIELDRISQISNVTRWGHRVFGFKINENKMYFGLNMIGDFGGATIWFMSEDKCDEAYSAIRQVNHMGLPVNRA